MGDNCPVKYGKRWSMNYGTASEEMDRAPTEGIGGIMFPLASNKSKQLLPQLVTFARTDATQQAA